MGESAARAAGRLLSAVIPVRGPGTTACTTTGSGTCAIYNDRIEESGGGCGVPGTRSRVRVGAKSRARLRNTLGASGVIGSRWSICSERRDALSIGWWRRRIKAGWCCGVWVEVRGKRVTTTRDVGPVDNVRDGNAIHQEHYPANGLSRKVPSRGSFREPKDRQLPRADVGRRQGDR